MLVEAQGFDVVFFLWWNLAAEKMKKEMGSVEGLPSLWKGSWEISPIKEKNR